MHIAVQVAQARDAYGNILYHTGYIGTVGPKSNYVTYSVLVLGYDEYSGQEVLYSVLRAKTNHYTQHASTGHQRRDE